MKGKNNHNIERLHTLKIHHLFVNAYEARVSIAGMKCPDCAARVHDILMLLGGVYAVDVSLKDASAVVLYDAQRVCSHLIEEAVSDSGAGGPHRLFAWVTRVKPHNSRWALKYPSRN